MTWIVATMLEWPLPQLGMSQEKPKTPTWAAVGVNRTTTGARPGERVCDERPSCGTAPEAWAALGAAAEAVGGAASRVAVADVELIGLPDLHREIAAAAVECPLEIGGDEV